MIKLRHFLTLGLIFLLSGCNLGILDPKGPIAADEKRLLVSAVVLMLVVVIPTVILTIVFAWRYRASNTKAKYTPEWTHSTLVEVVCWGVPLVIIILLATMTWISTHRLDPYKPLVIEGKKPLTIQVVALDWKWLFIYPEQKIATVNYLQIPLDTPINFLITADAPMNSLEIPQLAGQIYAMPGMQTKLHFAASVAGEYGGLSTSYSGGGFSDMKFIIKAATDEEFAQWIATVKQSSETLSTPVYNQLAKPTEKHSVTYYSGVDASLFNNIIMKYMMPESHSMPAMPSNLAESHHSR